MLYFTNVTELPPDPLFGLKARFSQDAREDKVDLGIGAYRDQTGKPWILPSVKRATALLLQDPTFNHEYLPITGYPAFVESAAALILGSNASSDRTVSIQSLSGTGALHLAAKFISLFYSGPKVVYLSNPTWANHRQIFENASLRVESYPYWDASSRSLDIDGFLNAIQSAPAKLVFLLHACAHNPTGLDPTSEQWKRILLEIEKHKHTCLFDSAYQGFASGDPDRDAWAVRHAVSGAISSPIIICQSFAKNCGMYGERVGALHVVLPRGLTLVAAYKSQLAKLARSEFSNPPAFGAKIVARVLGDPLIRAQWLQDLQTMLGRIGDMRAQLRRKLEALECPGTWDHVTSQQGMFSYTGLSASQVERLERVHGVYMVLLGRALVAGLNGDNVDRVAKAIDEVVRYHGNKL